MDGTHIGTQGCFLQKKLPPARSDDVTVEWARGTDMAASISQQLEDLLNPLPNFVDPEDDQDEGIIH